MRSEYWLRSDEQFDVLVSLRQVKLQLRSVDKDFTNWKWAVIALTSALNGALTCSLTGTMQVGALTKKNAEETISYFDGSNRNFPNQRLASPLTLFYRAIGTEERFERAGRVLSESSSQEDNFKRIFNLRNQFIHFRPSGWSIEIASLPKIFLGNIRIIEEIISDDWPFRHLDSTKQNQLDDLCSTIIEELETKLSSR